MLVQISGCQYVFTLIGTGLKNRRDALIRMKNNSNIFIWQEEETFMRSKIEIERKNPENTFILESVSMNSQPNQTPKQFRVFPSKDSHTWIKHLMETRGILLLSFKSF